VEELLLTSLSDPFGEADGSAQSALLKLHQGLFEFQQGASGHRRKQGQWETFQGVLFQ